MFDSVECFREVYRADVQRYTLTLDNVAPVLCTPLGGRHIDGWAETQPGQEAVFCAGREQDERRVQ